MRAIYKGQVRMYRLVESTEVTYLAVICLFDFFFEQVGAG